jgi:hypothetical protein
VILGLRASPQAWLDFINTSIGKVFGHGLIYYMTYFVPKMHCGLMLNNLWDQRSRGKCKVGVRTTDYYSFHNNHIRRIVPRERLLGFKAVDECELCEFLAREVPEGPYPHRNDGKAANRLMKSFAV